MQTKPAKTIAEKIMAYAAKQPEGALFSAKELLHIGGRAAVDQALLRLAKRGRLCRIGRGLYARPIQSRFGEYPPPPDMIARQIARRTGEVMAVNPAVSVNGFHLSTQVPVRTIYLTSGRSRKFYYDSGALKLELRHAPARRLRAPGTAAGDAFRALEWLGPKHAAENVKDLRKHLSPEAQKNLFELRAGAPAWLAETLMTLAPHG